MVQRRARELPEGVDADPVWTPASCLLTVVAIALIGVLLVVGMLLLADALALVLEPTPEPRPL